MKKFLISILVVSIAPIAYAEKISLNVFGGYAAVEMSDVNEHLDFLGEFLEGYLEVMFACPVSASLTKFGSGIILGVDGGYKVSPEISLGAKIAYLSCSQARLSLEGRSRDYGPISVKITADASLIPIMVGGYYSTQVTDKISLSSGLHFGFGFANAKFSWKEDVPDVPTKSFEIPYEGSGFVTDISARGTYQIATNVLLGVNFVHRLATIAEMKATKDVPEAKIKKGDVLEDWKGKDLKVDYSGVTMGIGLTFKF